MFVLIENATFFVSWALWLIAAILTPPELSVGVRSLFFLPGTVTPALVAVWFASRSKSTAAELLQRVVRWQVAVRWYVFAVLYIVVAKLTAAVVYRLAAGDWPEFSDAPFYLLLLATVASTPVQVGEELGWRGYLLPRLASAAGWPVASLVVGVVWASWHLPLFFLPGTDSTGHPFIPFVLAVTAVSVAMTWLYFKTGGSLLPVMLMHAAINNLTGLVPSRAVAGNPFALRATPLAWVTTAILWAGALYFLFDLSPAATAGRQTARRA